MLAQYPALVADWREELAQNSASIIFCWATWSPPDKMFTPTLPRVLPDYAEFAFYTADLDNEELLSLFIEALVLTNPQILLWREGQVVERTIGYLNEARLREQLDRWRGRVAPQGTF